MSSGSSAATQLSSEQRRRLLEKLLRKKADQSRSFPLSFAQQRLWLLDQLAPGNPAFNLTAAVRLTGDLKIPIVEASFNEIVRRHEVLRTTFLQTNGRPVQRLAPHVALQIPVVDLRGLSAAEQDAETRRLAAEDSLAPFNLTAGPLVRATLLRLSEEEYVVLFAIHHIVADGWSMALLTRELGVLYEAFSRGQSSPLPELPIQYADFANWQRGQLQGEALDEQLRYWSEQLDAVPVLDLPTDHPRPAVQAHRGAACELLLPDSLWQRLQALNATAGATPFMAMLAAFQALLGRYSGQRDIAVGTPIKGRNRAELEGLIGCFLNTLVLRTDLSGKPSFRELVSRVRNVAVDAFAHQDLPFETLLEHLRPERDMSRTPLFQAFFNMLNVGSRRFSLPGLVLELLPDLVPPALFDLTLYAQTQPEGMHLRLVYNVDLFREDRMVQMLEQYQQLLAEAVDHPDRSVFGLSLITQAAKERLPDPYQVLQADWNGSVQARFSQNARQMPDQIAISHDEQTLTYRQLDLWSNELANRLISGGIQSQDIVAVYGSRSPSLVCALLGILKAGGAFVILDPSYPARRLVEYVRIAEPHTLLQLDSAGPLPDALRKYVDASSCQNYLELADKPGSERVTSQGNYPDTAPDVTVEADDLAYLAFTSGTTGQPKAVQGTHRPLSHFFPWYWRTFDLGSKDRFSMLSGLGHDPLLRDIFAPLWLGATICIPESDDMSPVPLVDWMRRSEVTVAHLTPAHGQILATPVSSTSSELSRIESLRYMFFSGDTLTHSDVSRFRCVAPSAEIINFYGATETPQAISCYEVRQDRPASGTGDVPIGRGIDDVQLLVVNSSGTLCGVGEVGEIVVRTPYLSRGYLNDESSSRRQFTASPFSRQLNDRVYRTGDLGRYLPDGNVEILGRVDDQVKIRGFRIEPREVTDAISAHPDVAQAVVTARQDVPGQKRLVAYVVTDGPGELRAEALRSFLTARLHESMIPSAFVALEALPLTPNGKIDTRALPAPDGSRTMLQDAYLAPRTPREELVAEIWSEVLNVEGVGVHDNFFSLGGHSLLAVQVISRVREAFQVELPLRELFEQPTVAGLSATIERAGEEGHAVATLPLEPVDRTKGLPLSLMQERLWFLDQLNPGTTSYNMPSAVRLRGPLDVRSLERSFQAVVERHETLRTTFHSVQGWARQSIAENLQIRLPVIDLSRIPDDKRETEVRNRADAETHTPFDLASGPLLRTQLLRLGATEHVLLVTAHHIISDGWSMGLLIEEVAALYEAFCQGKPSPLEPLSIQYADYAVWQRNYLEGELLAQQLSYWKEQLDGAPASLNLPTDRPRPPVQTYRGAAEQIQLSAELSEALRELSGRQGVTRFMTLLAAFKVLLSRLAGQEDIAVGTPIAGRNHAEVEKLIGFFLNTLVLRADLSGNPTFAQFLARVREMTLGAYAHQDVPFEMLVKELQPDRDLSRTPLFQVFVNMLNLPQRTFQTGELELEVPREADRESKFDLTLYITDSREQIGFDLIYNADLFAPQRMRLLLDQFQHLLEQVVEDPDICLDDLSLVTDESQTVLPDPCMPLEEPEQEPITETIHDVATGAPDCPAIVQGHRQWTYSQLWSGAERIARRLRAEGIESGQTVAVTGPRSFGLIAAMLGVEASGGVLLLVDPSLPRDRQGAMLQQGSARLLVRVQREGTADDKAEDDRLLRLLHLDASEARWEEDADVSVNVQLPTLSPHDPAYVFFTSGSTGQPKGIVGTHQGLSHFLQWQRRTFEVGPEDRAAQLTALSFDVVLRDIFLPLTSGAALCLPDRDDLIGSAEILPWLERQRITIVHTVPSLVRYWLGQTDPGSRYPGIRLVFMAGEPLTEDLVRRWRETFDGGRIVNLYGPTETTLAKCFFTVPDPPLPGVQPVGETLPQTQALVLSPSGRQCGIGEPGEIVLRTPFRTKGYVVQANEETFVPNPFRDDPLDLIYRTGDGGRYRPDGLLEILGRLDDQVKIRGVRIEPSEVAAVLDRHPNVRTSVVLAQQDDRGQYFLAAYVVPAVSTAAGSIEEALQAYLSDRLPAAMLPSTFVVLDALPLLPNGKVNRRALPMPDVKQASSREYVPPRTSTEKELAELWADMLGTNQVGVEDNFFSLGGHSLLATQLISRIRETLGVELPLRHLFESPTLARLAAAVERAQAERGAESAAPLEPADRSADLPLSLMQERLWFLEQLNPGTTSYNMPRAVRFRGPLDSDVLGRCFQAVVDRHETLRTTFPSADGRPRQRVAEGLEIPFPIIDLSEMPEELREDEMRSRIHAEAQTPFDLANDSLVRVQLLRMAEAEHVLLLTMHHIISDAWSQQVLIREVAELYDAFRHGRPSPLSPLPIQYADYAVWQRRHLEGEVLDQQLSFWRTQLSGVPRSLDLPTDRPRPAVQSYRGGSEQLRLSAELTAALRQLSNRTETTLFMTLLASFNLLLGRLSGQQDVVVGTPIAGRSRREIEGLIGFFINTLVLPTKLSGDPTFTELLVRVRAMTLDAYAHQDVPFEMLVKELQPERDLSRTPLFQVLVNMLNMQHTSLKTDELELDIPSDLERESKFDLTLYILEGEEGLQLRLLYNADLFDRDRVIQMLDQYQFLLQQVVGDPDATIASYSLVRDVDDRLPDPGAPMEEPRYEPVTNQFAACSRLVPDALAVCQGDLHCSYADLRQRAECLAQALLVADVRRGDVVALTGPKSLGLVAAMLGIFSSGGVLLPIDERLPVERKRLMLREAKASHLIYVSGVAADDEWFQDDWQLTILTVDPDTVACDRETTLPDGTIPRLPKLAPDDAAYIFFTSGSTSIPKGLLGCHKGLSHFVQWQGETFDIGPNDRVAQLMGISFDAVLRDVFLPLTRGATLCLPETQDPEDFVPVDMLRWMQSKRITALHTVPALAQAWLATVSEEMDLPALRWTFFSGEPLTDVLVDRWRKWTAGNGQIVNMYGPTETTMVKCFYTVPEEIDWTTAPAGQPMPQTQALLMADGQWLCGIGEVGEIVLRTPFRTLGYINAPQEQKKRFVPNPYRQDPNDLLYRTGDRGRYRRDGQLEILGREDDQVKIHGVRVEPAEITATLAQHADVQSCFVAAYRHPDEQNYLVAYVVGTESGKEDVTEFRSYLQQRLPAPLVPSAFVLLPTLPLTSSGKVDRKALPEPDGTRTVSQEPYVAPRTPTEERIAEIWSDVLNAKQVGVYHNFFDLGGHSLLAVQVISRVRHALGVEIPLRDLFEQPTVARLAAAIEQADDGSLAVSAAPLEPADRTELLPLSLTQERLWFLEQLTPGASSYNMPNAVRLRGVLDSDALQRSFQAVVKRHETLRTTFGSDGGRPYQAVADRLEIPFPIIDLSWHPENQREEEVRRRMETEATTPFDLAAGPLLRTTLLRLNSTEHVLLVTVHHIISDAWSQILLIREVAALYDAFSQGQPSPLAPLSIQYADYAVWQRHRLEGQVLEGQLEYWKEQLSGAPPSLDLPTDRPHPAIQSYRGGTERLELSSDLSEALRTLSHRSGVTLFMTILAAFKLLLSRLSGQRDVVVGTPIAGRNRAEIEKLIGFFINTLVLRTDLTGDPTFAEAVTRVREMTLGAYAHQEVPFELLVKELQPERDLSRTPLFQVFVNMLNFPEQSLKTGDLELEFSANIDRESKFDLTLYIVDSGERIQFRLVYNADLFDRERIAGMLDQFTHLLSEVVAHPDRSAFGFPLITQTDEERLPDPTAAQQTVWHGAVQDRFSENARQAPDAIAIRHGEQSLTYRQLDQWSNRLANRLIADGVQSQDIVAIYGARSPSLVCALLGTLKAGAAFVILDVNYPAARLFDYARIASPHAWIQLQAAGPLPDALQNLIDASSGGRCLELSDTPDVDEADPLSLNSADAPGVTVEADDLAYLAFTSGTTGQPKAVQGTHRPLSHFFPWYCDRFNIQATDRFSMLSGLGHDPLLRDIFAPLWSGAMICIPDADDMSPAPLVDWMRRSEISVTHLTPAHGQLLAPSTSGAGDESSRIESLRCAFFGADVLRCDDVSRFGSVAPSATVVNFYGATETPQAISCYELSEERLASGASSVPIGRGIADVQLLLVNASGTHCSVGEVGEIYVRTPYLSRGYQGDAALTDERFLSNPFSDREDDRIYRTGDRGRYLPDGNVEILGRMDDQVKIRGFRVEPQEVAAVLATHPEVAQAAVVAREDQPGEKQLVAYVVADEEAELTIEELRGFLGQRLHESMIPSAFVPLAKMPLTPNGKIDTKALPTPDSSRSMLQETYVAPRTSSEELVAGIWSEVLNVERVGVHDNFFSLGGHSLLAVQVVSRLRGAFEVEVPLRELFEQPTVAGIAATIDRLGEESCAVATVSLKPADRSEVLPLSFVQERLWFLEQLSPGTTSYNMPSAIRLRGSLDVESLEHAFQVVVERHETLRTTFGNIDGRPHQTIVEQIEVGLPVIDLTELAEERREEEVRRLVAAETKTAFDLAAGPLLRTTLLRLSSTEHVLLVTLHHIVSDGWSQILLIREVAALYDAFSQGQPSPLAPLSIQYADYAVWQRHRLEGEVLEGQLEYWKEQLSGAPPSLDLPTDRPHPAIQSYRGGTERLELSSDLSEALRTLSHRSGVTLFMTILAAFKLLLSRLSGQRDVVVGTPIAGRNRAEIEKLIGFFINTLVLRTDLTGDPTFAEAVTRVREMTLGAYAHQEVPFELLVKELQPERDLSRTPLFQVFVNMLNFPEQSLKTGDLELEFSANIDRESKFDLTLYIVDSGERIQFRLVYNADLFDRERIAGMLDQFTHLLSEVVAHPDRSAFGFPLITQTDEERLPDPTAAQQTVWHGAVQDRFSENARQAPDAIAIRHGEQSLTYRQLDQWSNRLANRLIADGVQSQDIVAIYGARSPSLVCALLGTLKAGAAFVILDVNYPAARLFDYARIASPHAWIQLQAAGPLPDALQNLIDASSGGRCLELSDTPDVDEADPLSLNSADAPGVTVEADDLAYLAFTSGTTGQPKAVQGTHRPLSHFFPWYCDRFNIQATDRFSMLSGLGHDPLLRDIFAPLWSGAMICIPDADDMSPAPLVDWMRRSEISVTHLTPAHGQLLAPSTSGAGDESSRIESLRCAFFGADVLRCDDVSRFGSVAPSATVVNFYGATETPQAISCYELSEERLASGASSVPIGRGIADVQLLLVNASGTHCSVGEVGEIYVRTPYLSRGYQGDAALTDERFLSNPFSDREDDRIYRTGDRGRYLPDGNVEILGRMDDQVKIRGFRVEPQEVAAVLATHPEVAQAAVVVREDQPGEKQLVAYVVADEEAELTIEELRGFLGQRLHEAMVPSAFVPIKELPLTPNGKLDARALPAPDGGRSMLKAAYVAPRTPIEESVAEVWIDVLGTEKIGIHDNFFDLGGHSLLAVQVMSRIRNTFTVDVPLRKLFEQPTVAGLANEIETAQAEGRVSEQHPIPRVGRDGHLPTSFAQHRFWFLDQLHPGNPRFNMTYAVRLTGPLDIEAARRALQVVMDRHEAYRTSFDSVDGSPIQRIVSSSTVDLPVVDLSGLPQDEQEQEVWSHIRTVARHSFDLTQAPLHRILLLELSEQERVAVVTNHHIIGDAWSRRVLMHELVTLYEGFIRGQQPSLPALPIQYADFAVWQRNWLQGDRMETELSYWRERLDGLSPLELPTDGPRAAAVNASGARRRVTLSGSLRESLDQISRDKGVTLFVTLLAAFKVLLQRYSRQDDIAVGSTAANRNHRGTERVVGFFVNTVILRTDMSGDPTFSELLARVLETTTGALDHQDLPFERLVDDLNPSRELGRNPLSQVLVNYPRGRSERTERRETQLTFGPVPGDRSRRADDAAENEAGPYDLALTLAELGDHMAVRLGYNKGLYEGETVERMLAHYHVLLEAISADPDRKISELPLMDDSEQAETLVQWNDTAAEYATDTTIHELFETQVAAGANAVALVDDDLELTYEELNCRANRLAHYLRSLNVGPDSIVAVRLPRSADLIVALLGVLKAGGAYLPLDPLLPADRLRFTLDDARVKVLVTEEALRGDVPDEIPNVVCVDTQRDRIDGCPAINPEPRLASGNLAYVIYTSGSTGLPKGVMIEHRALVNYTLAAVDQYEITSADRVLQFASVSFDAHAEEVYPCLIRGGTLVLRRDDMLDSYANFLTLCSQWRLTLVSLPTAFWHELTLAMVSEDLAVPDTIRTVIIGGEAAQSERVSEWLGHVGSRVRLLNTYGPTETTVVATAAHLQRSEDVTGHVPIGRPLSNMRAYVLDASRQPLPIGVPGELYVGGESVARGYLARPELTAERFLDDPFVEQPGARMYKTGDLVRWRADGLLEFIGRTDNQVKIRGFRIEPDEVAQRLSEHPLLAQAVVIATERAPGDMHLVAYIVGQDGADPSISELRQFLSGQLPAYMIPTAYIPLDAMPMTTSGKVDRRALPEADWSRSSMLDEYVEPQTPTGRKLAEIWSDVLTVERVGANDDFFDLGGNSLMAVRLVTRMRDAFHVDLPLGALFAAPTIAGIAERIVELQAAGKAPNAKPIIPRPAGAVVPISLGQEPMWAVSQFFPKLPLLNIHRAVWLAGEIDVDALRRTVDHIVQRHEALRTSFEMGEDGEVMQVIAAELQVDVPLDDLSHLPMPRRAERARELARHEAAGVFDLSVAPLLRVRLVRLSEEEHVVLVTVNHLIADGWSVQLLVREVAQVFNAFSAGRPSPLRKLPIQYPDFTIWQRQYLQGEVLESLMGYWRKQLDGVISPELSADRPWRPKSQNRAGEHPFRISADLRARLERVCRSEDATPFMLMLAAYKLLLHRYSGSDDIAVVVPAANRRHREIEGVMGTFINMLVFRSDVSGDPTFRNLLSRVRQTAVDAYEHQELPFELIARELQPGQDLTRAPLVRVFFNYHQRTASGRTQRQEDVGVGTQATEREAGVARYELSLTLSEIGGGSCARLKYNRDMFDHKTIERMEAHYLSLLEGIASNPDHRLSQLPIMTEGERQQVLIEWNQNEVDFPEKACVSQLFEAQVRRSPDAIAAQFKDRDLTYGQLNERANQLAHHLQQLGVGPEVFVGVCLERSLDLPVAILAVIKAGGTFVPLDPDHPRDRLDSIVADACPAVILTTAALTERFSATNARVVCLDVEEKHVRRNRRDDPPCQTVLENAVYAIFTSGSTGKPKGAVNLHRGLCNRLLADNSILSFDSTDRFLLKTPISFDVWIIEFFRPLVWGARLVIAQPGGHRDPAYLAELIAGEQITVASFVPSLLRAILDDQRQREQLGSLRVITCGGEALTPDLLENLFQSVDADFYNMYGPTETSIGVVGWKCCRDYEYNTVPIGRPISNVTLYILDKHRNPVPVGVPGELYVGGAAVGRGYLKQPELTAEVFVHDPFSNSPEAMLYRTGDRCRYLPDGNVEFLGRLDHQVKIRGNRIELGEIEEVLMRHADVAEATVVGCEDTPGDQWLAAYVVMANGQRPDPQSEEEVIAELRTHLKGVVPSYMLPQAFQFLDALPQTTNGKLDRKALPPARRTVTKARGPQVAPSTLLEKQLAEIWGEVLHVDRISLHDNFFEMGGHSLLAVKAMAKTRVKLEVNLPAAALFGSPTIAELAEAVNAAQRGETEVRPSATHRMQEVAAWIEPQHTESGKSLVQLHATDRKPPLFCIHGLGGHVAAFLPLARHAAVRRTVYAFQGQGLEANQRPHDCIATMASFYLREMRDVQEQGPYLLAGWSMGGLIAMEMARQLEDVGQQVAMLVMFDTHLSSANRAVGALDNAAVLRWIAPHVDVPRAELKALPPEKQWEVVAEKANLSDGIGAVEVRRLAEVCKGHLRALAQHKPKPYGGQSVLFRATKPRRKPEKQWESICPQLRVEETPGDHYSMFRQPNVDALARRVGFYLPGGSDDL